MNNQHFGMGRQPNEFLMKNGMSQQLGGMQSMAASNKTIPKKDPLRESNQNFNTTQGIRSGNHLLAFNNQQDIKMKTSNLTNIGAYSKQAQMA